MSADKLTQARDQIKSVTTVTPTNEAQARELVAVPTEKRAEVWTAAVEDADARADDELCSAK